ncbi:hypothetical protein D3C80_1925040 [compost metagenome]
MWCRWTVNSRQLRLTSMRSVLKAIRSLASISTLQSAAHSDGLSRASRPATRVWRVTTGELLDEGIDTPLQTVMPPGKFLASGRLS